MQFSVLMSVYKNEQVNFFKQAIDSIINQTVPPNEIVLVRDGIVGEQLQEAIDQYLETYPTLFTYIPLEENGGLGNALRLGLTYCHYELVARMDTDDISVPDRFERQLEFLKNNPDIDIVGGNISEFTNNPNEIVDYRIVPQSHEDISLYLKSRSPFNHVTVMFKKQAVLDAGNYEHFYLFEDWYLWVKMYLSGVKFANINTVLVNVRISDMANRRGGMKYYHSCVKLLKFMKNNRVIGFGKYIKTRIVRFCGYVLLPNKMREWAYKKLLRNNKYSEECNQAEKIAQEV